ncbi:MAG: LacI family DNA-binding transcriptional regulator [Caldilineae bacterium]|nr:LacI family DNA-binding transcriptional regulator [Anaerolineae bacterium]MCB9153454.1 LacI family DNA-binding transcriptional regulator [Caldilineae bacterium]
MNHNAPNKVTIIDVAREAGVSYATVSRVLNDEPYVKPETRERVTATLQRMGYVANRQARSLRTGRSQMIGLLVRDLGTGYIGQIISGVDAEIAETDFEMLLFTTHHQAREPEYVATFVGGMADGLLLILPHNVDPYTGLLNQRRYPHVFVDYKGSDKGPAVGADNYGGAIMAIDYLVSLGHRRIGFITGALDLTSGVDRLTGYRQAAANHGLDDDPALVAEGDYHQPSGHAAAQALLSLPHRPTAIFAANDAMAFGAMEAIREAGLRIPDDMSVMGFDDTPQAAGVSPALTTIRQPLEEMGRQAVQMLLTYIEDPERPFEYRELATDLVVRDSCAPLRNAAK